MLFHRVVGDALTRLSLREIVKPPQFNETFYVLLFNIYINLSKFSLLASARSQPLILALPDAQNTQKARYVGYFDRQIRSRRRSVLVRTFSQ